MLEVTYTGACIVSPAAYGGKISSTLVYYSWLHWILKLTVPASTRAVSFSDQKVPPNNFCLALLAIQTSRQEELRNSRLQQQKWIPGLDLSFLRSIQTEHLITPALFGGRSTAWVCMPHIVLCQCIQDETESYEEWRKKGGRMERVDTWAIFTLEHRGGTA